MDYRGVLLFGAVVGAGFAALSTACTAPDPAAITFVERPSSSGSRPRAPPAQARAEERRPRPARRAEARTASSARRPSRTSTLVSARTTPTSRTKVRSSVRTARAPPGVTPRATGGRGFSPGRSTRAHREARPSRKVRFKVVGPNGAEIGTTYTDENGNFWLDQQGTTIPAGSLVAVRKEGGARRSTWALRFSRGIPVATRPATATADRPARSTRTESVFRITARGSHVRKRWDRPHAY